MQYLLTLVGQKQKMVNNGFDFVFLLNNICVNVVNQRLAIIWLVQIACLVLML